MKAAVPRFGQVLKVWAQSFTLLRNACPSLSIIVGIGAILETLSSLAVLYAVKQLVDVLSIQVGGSPLGADQNYVLVLSVTGAVLLGSVLTHNVNAFLRMKQSLRVMEYVDQRLHERATKADLELFDSPVLQDTLERARAGGAERPAQVVSSLVSTTKATLEIGFVLVLIASIEWKLLPLLVLPLVIALIARLLYTRRQFDWRMRRSQLERRSGYLDWLLTSPVVAKELRLHGTGEHFQKQYAATRSLLNAEQTKLQHTKLWTEAIVAVVAAIVFVLAAGWLIQQALQNERPVGDVVFFVLLLRRAETVGNELVSQVSKIVDDQLYLERLFEFLSLQPRIVAPTSPRQLPTKIVQGVRLEGVSFCYEGASQAALDDVSLEIRPGQVVALVGENGSGKTTLIKILTRLYDPSAGVVTLDGVDIRQYDPRDYRKLFSVIFQDFAAYADSAGENIRLGDLSASDSASGIRNAAEMAGAAGFIERLPKTYDALLTRMFDGGHELSGGQWQRIALARAFFPQSQFVILDEPTSAIDPKAENDLFQNFRGKLKGRSALLISHRLSTVRLADQIYVLENGRIVEHGTHESLVRHDGTYASLFAKQAQHYR